MTIIISTDLWYPQYWNEKEKSKLKKKLYYLYEFVEDFHYEQEIIRGHRTEGKHFFYVLNQATFN